MLRFVLDCSVAMAWCFEDEADPYAEALLDSLEDAQAYVPSLWTLETANTLLMAERRQRISHEKAVGLLEVLRALPVTVDREMSIRAFDDVYALAHDHGLTVYDAVYLELASRRRLPLATLDKALRAAAAEFAISAALGQKVDMRRTDGEETPC